MRAAWRRLSGGVDWALFACGAVVYTRILPHSFGADGNTRYATLRELAEKHHLSSARYSVVTSALAMPLYWLGKRLGDPDHVTCLFAAVFFFAGLGVLHLSLRRLVHPRVSRRVLLLLIVASMFPNHIEFFYGEVPTAVGLMLGLVWLARGKGLAGALSLIVAIVNTPPAILGAVFAAVDRARRNRQWILAIAPLAVATGLVLLESWVRRGNAFDGGYQGDHGMPTMLPYSGKPEFSYPLVLGVVSLLFSFGKGLVFFAPGLLLFFSGPLRHALPSGLADPIRQGIWVTLGLVLAYAKWWSWYGGWFWGPRFLLFASVPASMMIAAHVSVPPKTLGSRVFVLGVFLLSLWVGVDGAVWGQSNMGTCEVNAYQLESLCWYAPEFSALARPFIVTKQLAPEERLAVFYFVSTGAYVAAPLAWSIVQSLAYRSASALRRVPKRDRPPAENRGAA